MASFLEHRVFFGRSLGFFNRRCYIRKAVAPLLARTMFEQDVSLAAYLGCPFEDRCNLLVCLDLVQRKQGRKKESQGERDGLSVSERFSISFLFSVNSL